MRCFFTPNKYVLYYFSVQSVSLRRMKSCSTAFWSGLKRCIPSAFGYEWNFALIHILHSAEHICKRIVKTYCRRCMEAAHICDAHWSHRASPHFIALRRQWWRNTEFMSARWWVGVGPCKIKLIKKWFATFGNVVLIVGASSMDSYLNNSSGRWAVNDILKNITVHTCTYLNAVRLAVVLALAVIYIN